MTDVEILQYYADLLILQYKGLPKADQTVKTFVNLLIEGQLPLQLQDAFNVDTAVGAQLDIIGKYAGVTREGYSFTGPMTLDDDDYRKIIKLQIIKNNSGSSLYEIQNLLALYFAGLIRVFDYKDMSMSYYVDASFGSQQLVEFFINKNLLPAPMAVGIGSTIYNPNLTFFSFRTYLAPSTGFPFNTYAAYNMNWPWLSYAYALNATVTLQQSLLTEDGADIIVQENGDKMFI